MAQSVVKSPEHEENQIDYSTVAVTIALILSILFAGIALTSGSVVAEQGTDFSAGGNTPSNYTVWVINDTNEVRENFTLTDGTNGGLNITQNGTDTGTNIVDRQNTSALISAAVEDGLTQENDTVVVGPGVYNVTNSENNFETGPVNLTADNKANLSHIFSDAKAQHEATLNGTSSGLSTLVEIDNANYNSGLEIGNLSLEANNKSKAVKFSRTDPNAKFNLSNVDINDSDSIGMRVSLDLHSITISNSAIRNAYYSALKLKDASISDVTVEDSTFEDSNSDGIHVASVDDVLLRNNTINNNTGFGVQIRGSSNTTIDGGVIKQNDGYGGQRDILVNKTSVNTTADKVNLGPSTNANTKVSFDGKNTRVGGKQNPSETPSDLDGSLSNISRYVDGFVKSGGYLNLTIHYQDADVDDESSLALWRNPGGNSWKKVFQQDGTSIDTTSNSVTYNYTTQQPKNPTFGLFEDDTGTITGTVKNESGAVANAKAAITSTGGTYSQYNGDLGTDGQFRFAAPAGEYGIYANAPNDTKNFTRGIELSESEEVTQNITLSEAVAVTGYVKNSSDDSLSTKAQVVVNNNGQFYASKVNPSTGRYKLQLPKGETHRIVGTNQSAGRVNTSVTVTTDSAQNDVNISLEKAEITNENVSIIEGSGNASNFTVASKLQPPVFMGIGLNNTNDPGIPSNLSKSNSITAGTKFEINLTVKGLNPESLLWGGNNVTWDTEPNEAGDGTNVTIQATPVHLAGVDPANITGTNIKYGPLPPTVDTSQITFPEGTNGTAKPQSNWDKTVFMMALDTAMMPSEFQNEFKDVTVTTNAQLFSTPTINNNRFETYVAGPGKRPDGTNHSGFYHTFIPDRLLNTWDVDDPESELNTLVGGNSRDNVDIEVTDNGPNGVSGAWVRFNDIGYSDKNIGIEPDPSSNNNNNNNNGGSSGGSVTVEQTEKPSTDEDIAQIREQIEATEPDTETEVKIEDADPDTEGVTIDTSEESETVSEITLNEEIDGTIEVKEYTDQSEEIKQQISNTVAKHISDDVEEDITEEIGEEAEDDESEDRRTTDETEDSTAETDSDSGGSTSVNVVTVADISPSSSSGDDVTDTSATVTMTVNGADLNNPQNAVIVHETNEGWEELETDVEKTSEGQVTLTADTDSFSLFAVTEVEESDGATAEQTNETEDNQTTDESDETDGFVPGFGLPVAVLAMIATAMVARWSQE